MRYKGYFNFKAIVDIEGGIEISRGNYGIPLNFMMVYGGAKRYIDFNATDDISIISELEQARAFKNITLYLASTSDGRDMKAAADLAAIAAGKLSLLINVGIERSEGGNLLEGVSMFTRAKLKQAPAMYFESLVVTLHKFGANTVIERGRFDGTQVSDANSVEL